MMGYVFINESGYVSAKTVKEKAKSVLFSLDNTVFCKDIQETIDLEALHTYDQTRQLEEQHCILQQLYAQARDEIVERERIEAILRKREASLQAIVDTPKRMAFAVGDVSGKGVSAALLMSVVLSQFNASLTLPLSPAERLAYLNKALLPYTKQRYQNCALCYVEIEFGDECRLYAVNAGGISPLIKRRSGEIELLELSGLPLGIVLEEHLVYQCITTTLHVGDCVLLTSDGLIEATNADDELFGFHRLETMFANAPQSDAYGILKYFQMMLRNFVEECAPHDDLTMIVAQISAGENT